MDAPIDRSMLRELEFYNRELRHKDEQIYFLKEDLLRFEKEVITDPKTELYSAAFFYARLREEIGRSERYRHFFSVIVARIEPNPSDSTGNLLQTLRLIGQEIMMSLYRRTDIVASIGRSQIAIILPETDRPGAEIALGRLRATLNNRERQIEFGLLAFPEDASNTEMVLAKMAEISGRLEGGTLAEKA
jgi:GGDEF domain-containing protein